MYTSLLLRWSTLWQYAVTWGGPLGWVGTQGQPILTKALNDPIVGEARAVTHFSTITLLVPMQRTLASRKALHLCYWPGATPY